MKQILIVVGLMTLLSSFSTLTPITTQEYPNESKAFIISDNSILFEDLSEQYSTSLTSIYDNKVDMAFLEWKQTISAIKEYLLSKDIDLEGNQLWIKIFWSSRGEIDFIAIDFKPFSKVSDKVKLIYFLDEFVNKHNQNIVDRHFKSSFSNYSSF